MTRRGPASTSSCSVRVQRVVVALYLVAGVAVLLAVSLTP